MATPARNNRDSKPLSDCGASTIGVADHQGINEANILLRRVAPHPLTGHSPGADGRALPVAGVATGSRRGALDLSD